MRRFLCTEKSTQHQDTELILDRLIVEGMSMLDTCPWFCSECFVDAVATAPAGGPRETIVSTSRRREIGDVLTHVKVNVRRTTVELLPTAYVFNIVHQVQLEQLRGNLFWGLPD